MNLTDTIQITATVSIGRGKYATDKVSVPAKIYGPLAVHKDIVVGRVQQWKVTHVPTGLGLGGELHLKAAVALAKALKDMPEWHDPRLVEGRKATNAGLFDKLVGAVKEARYKAVLAQPEPFLAGDIVLYVNTSSGQRYKAKVKEAVRGGDYEIELLQLVDKNGGKLATKTDLRVRVPVTAITRWSY